MYFVKVINILKKRIKSVPILCVKAVHYRNTNTKLLLYILLSIKSHGLNYFWSFLKWYIT